jgi:hypothetical protein
MLYRIVSHIFRKHVLFHLLIPLVVGVVIEALYRLLFVGKKWWELPEELLSYERMVLYVGIFLAYLLVIMIMIRKDTNIGLEQLHLSVLEEKLKDAKGIFALGTMNFDEWFAPAVQVYLATFLERKMGTTPFTYERILLLYGRSVRRDLQSDYIDGYHAKCLINMHKRLGIKLYFLGQSEIYELIDKLSQEEKIDVGFYPEFVRHFPEYLARFLVRPLKRHRVRKLASAVIEANDESTSAFRFSKRDKIVSVNFLPENRAPACAKFVQLIREGTYHKTTGNVKAEYDFIRYYE